MSLNVHIVRARAILWLNYPFENHMEPRVVRSSNWRKAYLAAMNFLAFFSYSLFGGSLCCETDKNVVLSLSFLGIKGEVKGLNLWICQGKFAIFYWSKLAKILLDTFFGKLRVDSADKYFLHNFSRRFRSFGINALSLKFMLTSSQNLTVESLTMQYLGYWFLIFKRYKAKAPGITRHSVNFDNASGYMTPLWKILFQMP